MRESAVGLRSCLQRERQWSNRRCLQDRGDPRLRPGIECFDQSDHIIDDSLIDEGSRQPAICMTSNMDLALPSTNPTRDPRVTSSAARCAPTNSLCRTEYSVERISLPAGSGCGAKCTAAWV
jgi:hypothetical protein